MKMFLAVGASSGIHSCELTMEKQVRSLDYQEEVVFSSFCREKSTHFMLMAGGWGADKKLHLC